MPEVALVWTIDRTELIEKVYHLIDGVLELRPERYDMKGWPSGDPEKAMPSLLDCFDAGGWFRGAFDGTPDPELYAQEPEDIHLLCET